MLKLGIMGSTRGTDLQAIINGINDGSIDAQVNIVISNNKEAYILERAELNKLPFKFISDQEISREEFGNRATKVLNCLLYTSPSPRDAESSRMPSSA